MKLTFVSNYFNHHQRPLSDAFNATPGVDYTFIQTEDMEEERIRMGWGIDITKYPYVKEWKGNEDECRALIMDSDVVIWGGLEMEDEIEPRLLADKLTFRYSERIYKEGQWKFISPRGLKKKYHDHTRYRRSNVYLLCSGAFVGSDFNLIHAYPKKKFVWGYFPEVKHYDIDELMAKKSRKGERVRLLWAGRMIDWKHPEMAVMAADRMLHGGGRLRSGLSGDLTEDGFVLTMAGGGEMEEELKRMVKEKGLEDVVRFTGFMSPGEIRTEMEKSDIFLFTSDHKEGWGAVLNEAMNSGCLVIARPGIGAVPYMLQHGWNGMIGDGDNDLYCSRVYGMALDREGCREQGRRAYETMIKYWNAENAAAQFLRVTEGLLSGKGIVYSEKEKESGALQPMCRDPEIGPSMGARFAKRW